MSEPCEGVCQSHTGVTACAIPNTHARTRMRDAHAVTQSRSPQLKSCGRQECGEPAEEKWHDVCRACWRAKQGWTGRGASSGTRVGERLIDLSLRSKAASPNSNGGERRERQIAAAACMVVPCAQRKVKQVARAHDSRGRCRSKPQIHDVPDVDPAPLDNQHHRPRSTSYEHDDKP
jgi:hypothetical protein